MRAKGLALYDRKGTLSVNWLMTPSTYELLGVIEAWAEQNECASNHYVAFRCSSTWMASTRSRGVMRRPVDIALALAAAAFAIVPIVVFKVEGRWRKRPCIRKWPERASTDPVMIEGWFEFEFLDAVPGIALEHSRLVVVDADRHPGQPDGVAALREFGEMPPHPIVRTAGNGQHHYYRMPDPPVTSGVVAPAIELLGPGRLVVAPGCGGYELVEDTEVIPVLPERIAAAVTLGRKREQVSVSNRTSNHTPMLPSCAEPLAKLEGFVPTQNLTIRVRSIIQAVERAQPGNRNAALFWAACRLAEIIVAERVLTPEIATQLLIGACWVNGLVQQDGRDQCRETIVSAFRTIERAAA